MYQQSGPVVGQVNFFRFHGASDDIVLVNGVNFEEEYYVDSNGRAVFEVAAPGGASRVLVLAQYGIGAATWSFGLGLAEEGVGFPTWPITYLAAPYNDYSVLLRLEVPYGTMVKQLER